MDVLLLSLRVALSLGVVLCLLWFLHRRLTNRGARAPQHAVSIIARHQIGRRSSLVVVDVSGTRLVLGVTDSSVSVLASPPVEHADTDPTARPVLDLVSSRSEPSVAGAPSQPVELLRDRRRRGMPVPTPFDRAVHAARRRLP